MSGIMIAIYSDDYITNESLFRELVSLAKQLQAQSHERLTITVVGDESGSCTQTVAEYGEELVRIAIKVPENAPWPEYDTEALVQLCNELQPSMILLPKTFWGTEVAARLTAILDGSAAMDITAATLLSDSLEVTRTIFGGVAEARLRMARMPAVLVPHPKIWPEAEPLPTDSSITLFTPNIDLGALQTIPKDRHRLAQAPDVAQARILIAGGRGLGGPEPFKLLEEIASMIGGQVAASRPPVDSGWVSGQIQVGLTGKTVAPDLYIAVGISGAIQHITGCYNARNIVAINNDPHAPIFQYATYGVVGDWQDVLPTFYEALKTIIKSSREKVY
ncbi:MAG: electron transfer flavoprotein subunit alpha/FixB family protein [Nitrososphaerota archaeon]|jgi:electron transfer flavoprotein alpha subunit|nr:electron transfer flavoprotein subunit alpha/FixB family protein [Nitrososphaerota archaeon]